MLTSESGHKLERQSLAMATTAGSLISTSKDGCQDDQTYTVLDPCLDYNIIEYTELHAQMSSMTAIFRFAWCTAVCDLPSAICCKRLPMLLKSVQIL